VLNIAGIVNDSIVDGPGIRLTVFAQGCPHHCVGCHNAETWSFADEYLISEEEILTMVKANPLVRGVTFSGGEPFSQSEGFTKLAILLAAEGYEIGCYSGYTFEELISGTMEQQELLNHIHILIDGPYIQELRSMNTIYRGSSNQRIIDVKASLLEHQAIETTSSRWLGIYN